jgi:hypothetical protein
VAGTIKGNVEGKAAGAAPHGGAPPPSQSPSASSAAHLKRAAQIQRNEAFFRWLRRLVVPAFSIAGLIVLRPTEGHFLRYVAERRHLDADFNAWFPPVAAPTPAEKGGDSPTTIITVKAAAAASALSSLLSLAKKTTRAEEEVEGDASPPTTANKSVAKVDVNTAFRSPQDRDWAAQRFHYKKGSEDEERVARRRLLFARERAYLPDDTVVETIRSTEAQMEELRALREHPPMHLLREQLDALVGESKRYRAAVGSAEGNAASTTPPTPPQVLIEFEDHRLFATGAIVFRDKDGNVGRTMSFVGACGMLWKELR